MKLKRSLFSLEQAQSSNFPDTSSGSRCKTSVKKERALSVSMKEGNVLSLMWPQVKNASA